MQNCLKLLIYAQNPFKNCYIKFECKLEKNMQVYANWFKLMLIYA